MCRCWRFIKFMYLIRYHLWCLKPHTRPSCVASGRNDLLRPLLKPSQLRHLCFSSTTKTLPGPEGFGFGPSTPRFGNNSSALLSPAPHLHRLPALYCLASSVPEQRRTKAVPVSTAQPMPASQCQGRKQRFHPTSRFAHLFRKPKDCRNLCSLRRQSCDTCPCPAQVPQ